MKFSTLSIACASVLATSIAVAGHDDVDVKKLYTGDFRVTQDNINSLNRNEVRLAGLRMFVSSFNKDDGFGDGDDSPPGNVIGESRGSLQNNGTFTRINGLDAQNCLECHGIVSMRKNPMKFGIGGVGGVNNTVLGAGGGSFVNLLQEDKKTNIDGRVINPPFIFGAGGVELLANEMTKELNDQLAAAFTAGDGTYPLTAKGISFGSVTIVGGVISTEDGEAVGVEGVFDARPFFEGEPNDDFLVVAPFGRKGSEKSTRTFDTGALNFHFGMNIEALDEDSDGDGVYGEVTTGELSALSIFLATAQTPFQTKVTGKARQGKQLLNSFGCTECHVPNMETTSTHLGFRFPEIGNDPEANVYRTVDLTRAPMNFKRNNQGGITVPLFADLKRHYMGESLEEFNGDGMFTTMRLWGVADTAPYLHDGRALTIREAIVMHGTAPDGSDDGSEAFDAVSNFIAASPQKQDALLAYLDTLRSPDGTFPFLLNRLAPRVAKQQGVK